MPSANAGILKKGFGGCKAGPVYFRWLVFSSWPCLLPTESVTEYYSLSRITRHTH